MVKWIILGVYFIGIFVSAMIFSRLYQNKHQIYVESMIWPCFLIWLPMEFITKLFIKYFNWCYNNFSKK